MLGNKGLRFYVELKTERVERKDNKGREEIYIRYSLMLWSSINVLINKTGRKKRKGSVVYRVGNIRIDVRNNHSRMVSVCTRMNPPQVLDFGISVTFVNVWEG